MAAQPEYRAGAAASGRVRAVVLEDRRGYRAVFAEADFAITRAVSDFAAAQLVKRYELDRAGIVISGTASGAADPSAIVAAIEEAIANLDGATVSFSGVWSVKRAGGACVATFYPVRLDGCRVGPTAHGPIRAAFQMVDVPHGLQTREVVPRAYPVQAVAIGKPVVLALGGNIPAGRYDVPGRIVVSHANDTSAMPQDARVEAAVESVLRRVR